MQSILVFVSVLAFFAALSGWFSFVSWLENKLGLGVGTYITVAIGVPIALSAALVASVVE
jgi:hypothetical protein